VDRPFDLDLMFRVVDGDALHPDLLTQAFIREWKHAGLRDGVSLHSLRHTHASALLAKGEVPSEVAFRLGDDLAMVLSTYRHALERVAASKRERVIGEDLYR
jgi:integrase